MVGTSVVGDKEREGGMVGRGDRMANGRGTADGAMFKCVGRFAGRCCINCEVGSIISVGLIPVVGRLVGFILFVGFFTGDGLMTADANVDCKNGRKKSDP
jgi:hypothetical protein